MFLRRLTWANLGRAGIPALFVLRPLEGGFTPAFGEVFPIENMADKRLTMRARQLYEQKRIGTREELDFTIARNSKLVPAPARVQAVKHRRSNGGSS